MVWGLHFYSCPGLQNVRELGDTWRNLPERRKPPHGGGWARAPFPASPLTEPQLRDPPGMDGEDQPGFNVRS